MLFPYTHCLNIYRCASHQTSAYRSSAIHCIKIKQTKNKFDALSNILSPPCCCCVSEKKIQLHKQINIREWNQFLCGFALNMSVVSLAFNTECIKIHTLRGGHSFMGEDWNENSVQLCLECRRVNDIQGQGKRKTINKQRK